MFVLLLTLPLLANFGWGLYAGVVEFRAMLDEKIQTIAPHWKLSRMAATDRNVTRNLAVLRGWTAGDSPPTSRPARCWPRPRATRFARGP